MNNNIDLETRLVEQDHHSVKLWLRLLTCSSLIEHHLRSKLRTEFNTTLPRFDFMSQLERTPEGLTMGQLSRRMMVSGGNISGIANQLIKEGVVKRVVLESDRRTYIIKLTKKGFSLFQQMAKAHEHWIIELLGELPEDKVSNVNHSLGQIKTMILDNTKNNL